MDKCVKFLDNNSKKIDFKKKLKYYKTLKLENFLFIISKVFYDRSLAFKTV